MVDELEELEKLDLISKKINKELDEKNDKLIKFINKIKNKEQEELIRIKEKIQNVTMKKIYLKDSNKIDNKIEQLKAGSIGVSTGIVNLRRINKNLDEEIELYERELLSFIDAFKVQCSKNKNLKEDSDSLAILIEELF